MSVFSPHRSLATNHLCYSPSPPPMTVYFDAFTTPAGVFSVAVNDGGAVLATAFGSDTALWGRFRCGLVRPIRDTVKTAAARSQVYAYFAGDRSSFDLSLAPEGTPFQLCVWSALQRIPFGETCSYGALAKTLKSGARAIGRANATNPICLIVPCHRVIGADGSLSGFAFGQSVKRQLLQHEGAIA
jgi:methylated-DNA-[protein]-cysteine S-methyltransferase